jgi:PAS domain S-box-containing protein
MQEKANEQLDNTSNNTQLIGVSEKTGEEGMVLQGVDGTIQACNAAAESLLGVTIEQMQGYSSTSYPWQTIHEDGSAFRGENHPAIVALKTGKPQQNVVMGFYKPNGELIWLLLNSQPLFQADRLVPYAVVTTFTEIVQPKQQQILAKCDRIDTKEEMVRRQLAEIEAIYTTAPVGLCFVDTNLRFVRINQRLAEINGTPVNEHIGRTIREVLPELADRLELLYQRAIESGEPILNLEVKGTNRAQPGVERTWLVSYYPLKGDSGQVLGVNTMVQEITDRKKAEADLAQTNGILQAIVADSSDVIFVKDLQGRYVIANQTAASWLGIEIADILGKDDTALFTPDVAENIMKTDRHVLSTGASITYEEEVPKQGTPRALLSAKYPWHDGQGVIQGVIGISRDISDRKQVERQLIQFNADLELTTELLAERNQELNRFVYVVSHDLKAPLRAIANLSEWIEEDLQGQLSKDNQHQMELLRNRVFRMEAMIDGLLAYSRVGRTEVATQIVDVGELLAEILDSLAPPSSFTIVVQPNLPTIVARRLLLLQVFSNLISNSIKHHPRPDGRIEISATEGEDFYEFTVTDDGCGIAPKYHEKIFGIFQTVASSNAHESTGIGLSIVKKILENEGGAIALNSDVGKGTTFRFTWPRQPL